MKIHLGTIKHLNQYHKENVLVCDVNTVKRLETDVHLHAFRWVTNANIYFDRILSINVSNLTKYIETKLKETRKRDCVIVSDSEEQLRVLESYFMANNVQYVYWNERNKKKYNENIDKLFD